MLYASLVLIMAVGFTSSYVTVTNGEETTIISRTEESLSTLDLASQVDLLASEGEVLISSPVAVGSFYSADLLSVQRFELVKGGRDPPDDPFETGDHNYSIKKRSPP